MASSETETSLKSANHDADNDVKKPDAQEKVATNSKCLPFGVRSYLHQFYNKNTKPSGKPNGTIFEDPAEEYALLLKPKKNGNRYCRPILWKAAIWIGINFLVFGMIGIMVAYLVPKRTVFLPGEKQQYIVDEQARVFNHNLEIVKLVGLLFFCLGGILTVVGLLVPTLLWKHCFDAQRVTEPLDYGGSNNKPPSCGPAASVSIKATSPESAPTTTLDKVQPDRRELESVTTGKQLHAVE